MRVWLLVMLIGCGRIGFDARGDANSDSVGDGPVARCKFLDVATGRDHTCAIDGDGSVFCWGRNDYGQVNGATSGPKTIPTQVTLPAAATRIAVGRDFSCANAGGDVYCWGNNDLGQLGVGDVAERTGPVRINLGVAASDIVAGTFHGCAVGAADGQVFCWGQNQHFAVGTATLDAVVPTPTALTGVTGVRAISLGHRHGCAVSTDGMTRCWGRDEFGQLATTPLNDHAPMIASNVSAVDVSAGGRHTCGVDAAGQLHCWGRNEAGELGIGSVDTGPHATSSTMLLAGVTQIATGAYGTCAIHGGGTLSCWGDATRANGSFDVSPSPVDTPITDAAKLSYGYFHACVIRASGELLCWGLDDTGELGRGKRSAAAAPVAATIATPTLIAAGGLHVCAVVGADVLCWGHNPNGQLGNGTRNGTRTPTVIATGLTTIEGLSAGSNHTCAWGLGQVQCWGKVLGGIQLTPAFVAGFASVERVVSGDRHDCALGGGTVQCWGDNDRGQLGNNTMTPSATPVTVNNISAATAMCAGTQHACAIDAGAVKCWGGNGAGELGDNTQTDRLQPVAPGLTASSLACGRSHTCALDAGGDVYCWGRNLSGEIGLGTFTAPIKVPMKVTLPEKAVSISSGGYGTCARLMSGAVACWGASEQGEIGIGAFGTTAVPKLATGLANADLLAIGRSGGCARIGGVVKCFGDARMLGNGDNSDAVPMSPSFTCTQ
ncbi:MAG TPA: hypothetical protein VMZ53_01180 [Kofleriaceae bacterium]|nr:hypothetical protein [Kofleriaceae bacterium]